MSGFTDSESEGKHARQHVSPLDVSTRLDDLRALKEGWLDGIEGRALAGTGLDWLARQFEQQYPDHLRLPWLFPTTEGNVRAEWRTGKGEITLEINLTEQTGEWHRLDLVSGDEAFENIDLSGTGGWSELTCRLRELGLTE